MGKIYPIIGLPGHPSEKDPIGDFYVQFAGTLCAYDLPGGNIAMEFTPVSDTVTIDDGHGGKSIDGTYGLNIVEATGQSQVPRRWSFRARVGGVGQWKAFERYCVERDEDAGAAHGDGGDFGAEYEADGFEEAGGERQGEGVVADGPEPRAISPDACATRPRRWSNEGWIEV